MASVREVRQKLRVAMAILVGINVLAMGALAYFLVRGSSHLPAEFQTLHQQVQSKKAIVVAPETVDQRVKEAREQIGNFYTGRFPDSSAAIFETLGKVASENHVHLNQANYQVNDTLSQPGNAIEMPGVRQVAINAGLSGNYVDVMKFINALEREKTFFVVNSVALGDQQGGNVRLSITIETYMRNEA